MIRERAIAINPVIGDALICGGLKRITPVKTSEYPGAIGPAIVPGVKERIVGTGWFRQAEGIFECVEKDPFPTSNYPAAEGRFIPTGFYHIKIPHMMMMIHWQ